MNDNQVQSVLKAFPCMQGIPHDRWSTAEVMRVNPVTPHSIREGHVFLHAMFILEGRLRIYRLTPGGREITLYRVHGGQCCAVMMASLLGDTPYEAAIEIESETDVLLLPAGVFKSWMNDWEPLRQFVYKQIINRLTNVSRLVEDLAYESITCRLARYLLSACMPEMWINITHERLAAELGTAREVVSRTLKSFAERKIVRLSRGRITVLDLSALGNLAEGVL